MSVGLGIVLAYELTRFSMQDCSSLHSDTIFIMSAIVGAAFAIAVSLFAFSESMSAFCCLSFECMAPNGCGGSAAYTAVTSTTRRTFQLRFWSFDDEK